VPWRERAAVTPAFVLGKAPVYCGSNLTPSQPAMTEVVACQPTTSYNLLSSKQHFPEGF
jgi:hypothetical protein